MERIEIFECEGKQIIYFNLSNIRINEELKNVAQKAKETISGYQHASVYTLTNVAQIAFDTKTKEIAADWMSFNKPFVINAAFFGVTGVRKIMLKAVFVLSNRKNVALFPYKEQALAWIKSL